MAGYMAKRRLAVFDFDHTIVEENSDIKVRDLLTDREVREIPLYQRQWNCWTLYMKIVYRKLAEKHFTESTILDVIKKLQPVPGMKKLLKTLSKELSYDIIIISDANDLFIDVWLKCADLRDCVKYIFSNPAKFIDGVLALDMYQDQQTCKLSAKNLCKGAVMEEFVLEQQDKGITYQHIFYVGDGRNDFCPILRLHKYDIAFVRRGYQLMKMVQATMEKKPIDPESTTVYSLHSKIVFWTTADEILDYAKKL